MDESVYLMALQSIKGVGEVTLRKLVEKFGSAKNVFESEEKELLSSGAVRKEIAQSIKGHSDWDIYLSEFNKIKNSSFNYLTYQDNHYPTNLKNIYNIPLLMQFYGSIHKDDNNAIAIVGSRNCDEYGRHVTETLVKKLVERGVTIVSGMARGIDTFAHKAALKYGGRTIAVVGTGLDVCYPPENKKLFEEISRSGYILSEYGLGTQPDSVNFPKRNRIISGLSLGVVVIQAGIKSGALITAHYALDQGREVFAVPANIINKKSSGCNHLIKSGAKLVEDAEDIISELKQLQNLKLKNKSNKNHVVSKTLGEKEKIVLTSLERGRLHMDELIVVSGLRASEIYTVLLDLEISGILRVLPGNFYELSAPGRG